MAARAPAHPARRRAGTRLEVRRYVSVTNVRIRIDGGAEFPT
jgi:hypothetical protein